MFRKGAFTGNKDARESVSLQSAQTDKTMKTLLLLLTLLTGVVSLPLPGVAVGTARAQDLPVRRNDTLRLPPAPASPSSPASTAGTVQPAAPALPGFPASGLPPLTSDGRFDLEQQRMQTPPTVLRPIPQWVITDRFCLNSTFLLFESGVMISNGQAQNWNPAWWRGVQPFPGAFRDARTLSMPIPR